MAGLRAGLNGSRSGLFYELTRIASERHPAVFVWENVPGLLSSGGGRDFARVLMEMDRIGYHGGWRVLDAQYLGVAQRRRRVFGVFVRRDLGIGRAAEILSLAEGLRGHPAPRRESGQDATGTLTARARAGGGLGSEIGALTASMGRSLHSGGLPCVAYRTTGNSGVMQQGDKTACLTTNADPSAQIIQNAYGVRRLTPRECERLQGFPEDWTAGFADGVRYTMLGNAVAVPAAHWIGRRLVAALGGAV